MSDAAETLAQMLVDAIDGCDLGELAEIGELILGEQHPLVLQLKEEIENG